MQQQTLTICEQCDAVHQHPEAPRGARAYCVRCGATLMSGRRATPQQVVAMAVAGLVTFFIANGYPIMSLEIGGEHTQTTLLGAITHSSLNGLVPLAAMTAISLFIFPLLQIVGTLYVLVPLLRGQRARYFAAAMHALQRLRPWSMLEVFLLGAMVAFVKLDATATVIAGVGLYAFGALTLIMTALGSFDLREIWELSEQLQ